MLVGPDYNKNHLPSGNLQIVGLPERGQLLTAITSNISDKNGLGNFTYSWLRDGFVINNAKSPSYIITNDDIGFSINALVSYTDGGGTIETLKSSSSDKIKSSLSESLGAISLSNSGKNETPVLDFYINQTKDLEIADVTSFALDINFDPSEVTFKSLSFANGINGELDDTLAANGKLTFSAVGSSSIPAGHKLFSISMKDLDATSDFAIVASNLTVNSTQLDGSTFIVGNREIYSVVTSIVDRGGAKISDSNIVINDGKNSYFGESQLDENILTYLTAGSTFSANATISSSSKAEKAITVQDALDALRLSAGLSSSNGTNDAFEYIAADYDKDGIVSSDDAMNILKHSIGLSETKQTDWVFVDTNGDYSNISKSDTSYDQGKIVSNLSKDSFISLTGVLIGDVNHSYGDFIA